MHIFSKRMIDSMRSLVGFLTLIFLLAACASKDLPSAGTNKKLVTSDVNAALYRKGDGVYEYDSVKADKTRQNAIEIPQDDGGYYDITSEPEYSPDGKYLYYYEYSDENKAEDRLLPKKALKRLERSTNKDDTISDDVWDFKVLKNGNLLFLTARTNELYLWDGEKEKFITNDVGAFYLNENEDYMLIAGEGDDFYEFNGAYDFTFEGRLGEAGTLYFYDFAGKTLNKLDEQVLGLMLNYSKDFSVVYYAKKEGDVYALYAIKDIIGSKGKDVNKSLITKVDDARLYMDENTNVLYYIQKDKSRNLYDIVIEDDLPEDKSITPPDISTEDKKLMFETKEFVKDKGLTEYAFEQLKIEFKNKIKEVLKREAYGKLYVYEGDSPKELADFVVADFTSTDYEFEDNLNSTVSFTNVNKDEITKIKLSELLEEFKLNLNKDFIISSKDESLKVGDVNDIDWDKLLYDYYYHKESPLAEYVFYEEETNSDETNGGLENYRDKYWVSGIRLSTEFDRMFEGVIFVQPEAFTVSAVSGDKVYDMKTDKYHIKDIYIDDDNQKIYYVKLNENEILEEDLKVENSAKNIMGEGRYDLDYFHDQLKYDLYKADLSDGELSNEERFDKNVSSVYGMFDNKLYYFKPSEESYSGKNLYCDKKLVKKECKSLNFVNDIIYIATESEDSFSECDLYMFKEDEVSKISKAVSEYKILPDKSILYIQKKGGYDSEKNGKLKLWKGNDEDELVDKDVIHIFKSIDPAGYRDSDSVADYMKMR